MQAGDTAVIDGEGGESRRGHGPGHATVSRVRGTAPRKTSIPPEPEPDHRQPRCRQLPCPSSSVFQAGWEPATQSVNHTEFRFASWQNTSARECGQVSHLRQQGIGLSGRPRPSLASRTCLPSISGNCGNPIADRCRNPAPLSLTAGMRPHSFSNRVFGIVCGPSERHTRQCRRSSLPPASTAPDEETGG